ncbi:MAG: hypothetical protein CMN76_03450 [Spirochaetaceae bacterium]|nr:hypothetical protein [Spirochaetaceae bacterium]
MASLVTPAADTRALFFLCTSINAGPADSRLQVFNVRLYQSLMGILFIVAAAVQWNDPDPTFWISIYGIAALLSIGEVFWLSRKSMVRIRSLLWPLLAIAALIYGLSLFHGLEGEWYNDEVTRESGGLFLITLHGLISYWAVRGNSRDISKGKNG